MSKSGLPVRHVARALIGGCMVMASLAAVLLGGASAQAASPSLTAWAQANGSSNGCTDTCPGAPTARGADSIAYDGSTGNVVLFGGVTDGFLNLNDTWTWDGSTWTQVADASDAGCTSACVDSPSVRSA